MTSSHGAFLRVERETRDTDRKREREREERLDFQSLTEPHGAT